MVGDASHSVRNWLGQWPFLCVAVLELQLMCHEERSMRSFLPKAFLCSKLLTSIVCLCSLQCLVPVAFDVVKSSCLVENNCGAQPRV